MLEKGRCLVAEVISPSAIDFSPDSDIKRNPGRALSTPAVKAELAETWEFQVVAEKAAGNGSGTAKSTARILSAVSLGGTVDGKKLLSPETAQVALTEQISGKYLPLGTDVRFGLGFELFWESGMAWIREGNHHWGARGGSMAIMDPINGMKRPMCPLEHARFWLH